jgi:hypothetical protein
MITPNMFKGFAAGTNPILALAMARAEHSLLPSAVIVASLLGIAAELIHMITRKSGWMW